jgi:aspartate/methionine/tyrosine aminotransferase
VSRPIRSLAQSGFVGSILHALRCPRLNPSRTSSPTLPVDNNVHRSYAIPGHRLGGLVASRTFLSQISKLLDCMQICPARPAQRAVEWAITGLAEWRRETREQLQDRQRVFRELLLEKEVEGWEVATGGAYFAYVGFSLIPISCRCRVLAKLTPP